MNNNIISNNYKTKNVNSIISDDENVTMKICGNHVLIVSSSNRKSIKDALFSAPITKLSSTEYINNHTGETKEFQNNNTSYKNYQSLRRSLIRLHDTLLCNLVEPKNCVGLTLTYGRQMLDFEQMNKDLRNFINRLHSNYGDFKYIFEIEPQQRASFHYHGVLCFDHKAPFVSLDPKCSNSTKILWKNGFGTAKSIKSDSKVANYFTKYNLNLKYETAMEMYPDHINEYETIQVPTKNGTGTERQVKGIAIRMLPKMMNIIRHSPGIITPTVMNGTKKELLSGMNDLLLKDCFIQTHKDEDSQVILNTVKHERYTINNIKGDYK